MTDRIGCSSGRNLVAALFLAATLTACGGGGGSSTPSSDNPPSGGGTTNPPGGTTATPLPAQLTYSGAITQAKLDAQSSPVLARALISEIGFSYAGRSIPSVQVQKSRIAAKLSSKAVKSSDALGLTMPAATTESCAGGGSLTTDDQLNASGIGTIKLTFAACVEDDVKSDGVTVLTVAAIDATQDVPTDFTIAFYGYTRSSGDASIEIGGSVRTVITPQSLTLTFNTVTRSRPQNIQYRLANMVVTHTRPPTEQVTSSLQGRMYHSALGYVDVSTSTSISLDGGLTGSTGTIRMQGAASSSADVSFLPASRMRLSLDEDGDGVAERSLQAAGVEQFTLANHRPDANAGPDLRIEQGQTAILSGSGADWEGDALTYEWAIISGPVANRVIGNTAQVSFTPSVGGTYVLQLRVSDLPPFVSTDTMTLVVAQNAPPVARAGEDFLTLERTAVTLDGAASTDAENDPIQFTWVRMSAPVGSSAPLSINGQSWNFTPDRPGPYLYRLTTADAHGYSFDYIRIGADYAIRVSSGASINVDASTTLADARVSEPISASPYYSGAPVSLNVTTDQSWLSVISAPANTSGGNLILGVVPAQLTHMTNGTYTALVTITPTGYTPFTLTLTLNLDLPYIEHVTPYVGYTGAVSPVTLYGGGLQQTAGGTLLIDGVEIQGFTDSLANRARITLPALSAGEHQLRVKNNLGVERSARFVVRPAPTYPDGQFDILGRVESLEYDKERDAFYVVSWDLNYTHHFDAYRLRYVGGQWQRDPILIASPLAVSLNVDGTRLYVTTEDCSVHELDPNTFASLQVNTKSSCYYERFEMVSSFADGRMVVANKNQWPTVYAYPSFTTQWSLLPSAHSPIHLLNDTRERLLWAESPTISEPHELYVYEVATSSIQQVAVHDPGTYFLSHLLGISGDGRRFMHGADVYEGIQYIGSVPGVGPNQPNPALTRDGSRAVVFDPSTNRLSLFDLTHGPSFPLITDLMTVPETAMTWQNTVRVLPNDKVALLFSTRSLGPGSYAFRTYVRNLP